MRRIRRTETAFMAWCMGGICEPVFRCSVRPGNFHSDRQERGILADYVIGCWPLETVRAGRSGALIGFWSSGVNTTQWNRGI